LVWRTARIDRWRWRRASRTRMIGKMSMELERTEVAEGAEPAEAPKKKVATDYAPMRQSGPTTWELVFDRPTKADSWKDAIDKVTKIEGKDERIEGTYIAPTWQTLENATPVKNKTVVEPVFEWASGPSDDVGTDEDTADPGFVRDSSSVADPLPKGATHSG
jgi:hypothetical protein